MGEAEVQLGHDGLPVNRSNGGERLLVAFEPSRPIAVSTGGGPSAG